MPRLSVNINKLATLRNARGGNVPDIVESAKACERFGAEGITVHPRPDERHIRYQDVKELSGIVTTEFNIEGYPTQDFINLVLEVKPTQVTLVPDPPDALTSNSGWDTLAHFEFLKEVIGVFKSSGIRTSLFTGTAPEIIQQAALTGTDRIELYTEPYAIHFLKDQSSAVLPFVKAAELAHSLGLKVNAGHDLNLDNLEFFAMKVPFLEEVSIGHAFIADALYFGLQNTVALYRRALLKV